MIIGMYPGRYTAGRLRKKNGSFTRNNGRSDNFPGARNKASVI